MKNVLVIFGLVGILALRADAAISVISDIQTSPGVRAQAIIKNKVFVDERGNVITAVAIKEITSSMLIRDDNILNGIAVTKRQLSTAEAWGQGLNLGYTTPPFTDPEGPWQGLIWPYRDQYDYFPDEFDPLGDDVGIYFQDDPGVYGFVDVAGIARGGPTDPVPPPGQNTPAWLTRGITGNGLTGPASYFNFEITPLIGPYDRSVRLQIFGASAIVVTIDEQGVYGELRVSVPDFETFIQLPEPSSALVAAAFTSLAIARRRRR